jgi:predicted metalloprotease
MFTLRMCKWCYQESDKFYPSFLCTTSNVWDLFFYWKNKQYESIKLVDFSNLTMNGIPMLQALSFLGNFNGGNRLQQRYW